VTVTEDAKRFEFGKNWRQFVEKHYSQEVVEVSKARILEFVGRTDLAGVAAIDIGCGSGIHSMAMFQAGAAAIDSFDYDPSSVEATELVRAKAGAPAHWTVRHGSVLDDAFMRALPTYDLVYSWGVLHHTGDVWKAMALAAERVKPGGLFYIALYSADVQKDPPPQFWIDVKRTYVNAGPARRRLMDLWYVWRFMMNRRVWKLPQVVRRMREYRKDRGMNLFTDIRDWLGGWPMEFVWDADAIAFCEAGGFRLQNLATGKANTEFLFVKSAQP
jgi:2-polyprenyl-6-hydroxyphenyl methylase/3-demethylubiquinone-9 3-methyltransferase